MKKIYKKHKNKFEILFEIIAVYLCFYLVFEKEEISLGFWLLVFINGVNFLSGMNSNNFIKRYRELVSGYEKMTDDQNEKVERLLSLIDQKNEHFKQLRIKMILTESKFLEIKDMNERLNQANAGLRRENQDILSRRH